MKKIFLVFAFFLSVSVLNAAELFYSNGTSVSIQKAEDMYTVRSDVSKAEGRKDALYTMNTGRYVYSVVSGTAKRGGDELPVYFLGEMPAVAERTVFWRGEKSVEYMEKRYGMKLAEIFPTYPLYSFEVQDDSVEVAGKIVKNGDGYAFPDFVHEADQYALTQNFVPESEPKDPYFEKQWHLHNSGTAAFYYTNGDYDGPVVENADTKFLQMLQFLNSNGIEVDPNTKIAIMDSGVADHDDLNISRPGYDVVRDDDTSESAGSPNLSLLNGSNVSTIAHGTECAGVSAGVGNETGMSGMCPWCLIYPVRYYLNGVFSSDEATAFTYSKMLKIYEKYVSDPNIVAVNCSFGPDASGGASLVSPALVEGIRNFMLNGRNGKGGAIVYASGNDNTDSSYNRIFEYDFKFERDGIEVTDRVVTVNATTAWDTKAEYSNYGHATTVSAPSRSDGPVVGIAAATIPGLGDYPAAESDYTRLFGGTSAAAPVVSGLFGVIFSINPDLTLEQALEILKQSSDKINPDTGFWDETGFSVKYGYGRVNLEKAVRLAKGFSMCESVADEVCGNHLDDDCDGYVDEDCAEELPQLPPVGEKCENDSDCASDPWKTFDVACLKSREAWVFDEGYCVVKSNINTVTYSWAPCPDGTRILGGLENDDAKHYFYYCALECNRDHQCQRDKYYCSDEVLGVCLPLCRDNSGCTDGYSCNSDGHCVPQCGNGRLDGGEECDNGEDNGRTDCAYGEHSCQVCTSDCKTASGVISYCGDRDIDPLYGEECDNGSSNGNLNCSYGETSCTVCTSDCREAAGTTSYCGDGITDTSNNRERCDNGEDNGRTDCDYGQTSCIVCTTGCRRAQGVTSYCGDSRLDEANGEKCDNGADNGRTKCAYGETSCSVCTAACKISVGETSYCGDGIIDSSNNETCDGASDNGRTDCAYGEESCQVCTSACRIAAGTTSYCGDGIVDGGHNEACDNGFVNGVTNCLYGETSCSVCTTDCRETAGAVSFCGDGITETENGERCDEGEDNGEIGHCNSSCSGIVEIPGEDDPDEDAPDSDETGDEDDDPDAGDDQDDDTADNDEPSDNDETDDDGEAPDNDGETSDHEGTSDSDETSDSDNEEKSDNEEVPDSSENPDEGGNQRDDGNSSDDETIETDDSPEEPASDNDNAAAEDKKKSGGCSLLVL